MNRTLLTRHCPALLRPGLEVIGAPGSDGAGLELGLSVGGGVEHLDSWFATSPIYPPEELIGGILVNRDGRRFVAEDAYHGRTTAAILRQPEAKAWLICDLDTFDRPLIGQALVDAWESVEEMEAALGIEPGALVATIADYNDQARLAADPQMHKGSEWLRPLENPPYAALDCSLGAAPFMAFTLGGLMTDVEGRVLSPAGRVITGLYAAGAAAANLAAAQRLDGYASGTCIGESTFFGRRAGRSAAAA